MGQERRIQPPGFGPDIEGLSYESGRREVPMQTAPVLLRRASRPRIRRLRLLAACLLAGAATAQLPAQSLGDWAPKTQTPPPVLNGTALRLGHYEPSKMLRLAIVLNLPHPDEEQQFLDDVQNRQSPLFHHYLSADEWNARFAPSAEDEQAVADWAKSQGLTITHRYPNRLVVDVEAPSGTIEKAFGVQINRYQAGDEVRFSNDRDPILPSALESIVQSVQGLNSFERVGPALRSPGVAHWPDYVPGPVIARGESFHRDAQPEVVQAELRRRTEPQPEYSSKYHLQPSDILSSQAYNYNALMNLGHCCNPLNNPGGSPKETSIAVALPGAYAGSDLNQFLNLFPYLAANVQSVNVDGGYTCDNVPKFPDPGCIEATLDTEWALVTSNSEGSWVDTSAIYVYEVSNGADAGMIDLYNAILNDDTTRVMTTSYGCVENLAYLAPGPDGFENADCYDATMQARDSVLAQMVGEGWTLVAASGDHGASGSCQDFDAIIFPSSDPNVVAAGGTYMKFTSKGDFSSETAWEGGTKTGSCGENDGGSTGGFSVLWPEPSYQSFMGHSKRSTPDIALNAANGEEIYDAAMGGNGEHSVGGTSIVAPELAGFFAQENAYLLYLGDKCGSKGNAACAPLGNPLYAIYAEGVDRQEGTGEEAQHNPFYDITKGCNSNDITAEFGLTYYCAKKGFDHVTGWGSANMLQLAWAINWHTAAAKGAPDVTFKGPALFGWFNSSQIVKWTVHDHSGIKGVPGTGIAGFTQGWDSIPSDPSGEATPGAGNSFYSGPQFANVDTGCLAFVAGDHGCSGGVSQGCHTVYVRAWNNQGVATDGGDLGTPYTYGPICYDTVPPVTTISALSVSGSLNFKISLSAADPGASTLTGSGVAETYYAINDSACAPGDLSQCKSYAGPFDVGLEHTITYFSKDNAGNFEKPRTYITSLKLGF